MEIWRCEACGHVYDPDMGDAQSGREPDMPFEDHPASWVCPDCGAAKDKFAKEKKEEKPE